MSNGHAFEVGSVPVGISLGACPVCQFDVLFADPALSEARYVLLDPVLPERVSPSRGMTAVVVSAVGRPQVVEPWIYRLHSCPPGVITKSIGFYSVEVLSQSCPVILCHSQPGELCISTRHEVLSRPHGSRVILANRPLLDDDSEGQ
jgi:hypothetical protein